ncbi:DUF11 domain-containing protein [Myroides sp. WP-1]|uniref:DUF7507 domain-containing protein n=1 Tax=Myroides sp. WP-1 TaxID=2759944 RepID=UPI0015FC057F|nr:DUF11 domain-containing protein [Myroides sp. WP-1]MBB1140958.1 hypothetical protein [Myroides sp. WP-1]
MNKKVLFKVLLTFALFLGIGNSMYAQFEVKEDFKGATTQRQNVVFIEDAYLTASNDNTSNFKDTPGNGWLRLTEDKGSRSGGVIINEAFASDKGVILDFEYKTWRTVAGNDKPPFGWADRGGDGFSVFLIDGSLDANLVTLGGTGHHLGYGGDYYSGGITGGYLGLGLDEYGNYVFRGTEGVAALRQRETGRYLNDGDDETEELRYSLKNSVGLRGKGGLSQSNNNTPLIGFSTLTQNGYEVGYPTIVPTRPSDATFYRRVQMELYKYGNGYKVEVRWMREKDGVFEHLFTSDYAEAPFATLKIGFAASTGSAVNFHEIRGLSVFIPEGVKVEKFASKDQVEVGEDLTYRVEVRNLSQSVYNGIKLNDILDNLRPYYEVSSISFASELGSATTIATNFVPTQKTLQNVVINLASRDAAIFTIKGKVKQLPASGKITNTATIDISSLNLTSPEALDPAKLTSSVETAVVAEAPCGCPEDAIQLTSTSSTVVLQSNKKYCVRGEIHLSNSLEIELGSQLYVESGARLKVTGTYKQKGGLVKVCPAGGILVAGSAELGNNGTGEYSDAKVVLKESAFFTMTGSLTQHQMNPANEITFSLDNSAVVEVCGTYKQHATTYPVMQYTGNGRNAYFIVKGDASGDAATSRLRDSDLINVVTMDRSSNLGLNASSVNYSGDKAKGTNKFLPKGYNESICGDLGYLYKGKMEFKKEGTYVQGDRSMYNESQEAYKKAAMVGDLIKYTFTVKNTGNIPLHDVRIDDARLANATPVYVAGDVNNNRLFDVDEVWTYEAIYYITQEDIDQSEKVNQATAHALTDGGTAVSKISGTEFNNEKETIVPLPFGAVDEEFCDNEGDQFISGFHTTIVKTKYGFEVFGERGKADGSSHAFSPIRILPENGYEFKGSPIIASMGTYSNRESQFFLLTSKGLYAWGTQGAVISTANTTSSRFQEISLPTNVSPRDIDYMTASYKGLVLKTTAGKLYVKGNKYQLYGDGSSQNDNNWHVVKRTNGQELTNVKQVKMHLNGGFALLNDNTFVAWGERKYTGTALVTNDNRAQEVSSPIETGHTPKMIALTGSGAGTKDVSLTYLVLSTSGKVYSLGGNAYGQLGNGEGGKNKDKNKWQTVKIDKNTDLDEVIFITGADNSAYEAAAGAINKYGKLFLWGRNSRNMLGQSGGDSNITYATVPQGFLNSNGSLKTKAIYVEIGGHTTMFMGEDYKFCYVGHKVNGSMGDGLGGDSNVTTFDCSNTPHISEMCAKLTIEPEPGLTIVKDGEYIGKNGNTDVQVGGKIKYTIKVSNSGNTLLSNINVTDPKLPNLRISISQLNEGEIREFTGEYIITQEDIDRGGVFNQALGNANTPTGPVDRVSKPTTPVAEDDPNYPLPDPQYPNCETCTVTMLPQSPKITLIKTGVFDDDVDGANGNGVINYTFVVQNTGNVTLKEVELTDALLGAGYKVIYANTGGNLAIGASWTVTATYDVTDADLENESVSNQAKVVGKSPKDKTTEANSGTEIGNNNPTITPVEGGGPLITNPHIYHKVQ